MNIIDKVLAITLYGFIDKKIQGPDKPYWKLNKEVLSKLSSISPDKNNFYFFHLYAPHWPYSYFDEHYEDKSLGDLDNHILFKRFFLNKLLYVLNDSKFKSSRIIITGDHGYRFDPIIDKTKTSLYIKGMTILKMLIALCFKIWVNTNASFELINTPINNSLNLQFKD